MSSTASSASYSKVCTKKLVFKGDKEQKKSKRKEKRKAEDDERTGGTKVPKGAHGGSEDNDEPVVKQGTGNLGLPNEHW
jgi:hypothetical protein